MQQQTANTKRKKKPNLWGLAGLLFCLNVAVYYFMFIWPVSAAAIGRSKPPKTDALSNANISSVGKKY
jgi:hypothetical protein